MEGFQHDADDHLFEKELIRMCIDQLLEEDDELETSTEEIFSSQKAKNMHYNSPIYQVIGQKPKRDATHGKSNTYAKVLSGNYKNNMGESKLNPNAKVFVPQGLPVRTSS